VNPRPHLSERSPGPSPRDRQRVRTARDQRVATVVSPSQVQTPSAIAPQAITPVAPEAQGRNRLPLV